MTRIDPDGRISERIDLPLEKPSMPAFGGKDLDILFLTTIGEEHGRAATLGKAGEVPGSLLAVEGTGATGEVSVPYTG